MSKHSEIASILLEGVTDDEKGTVTLTMTQIVKIMKALN